MEARARVGENGVARFMSGTQCFLGAGTGAFAGSPASVLQLGRTWLASQVPTELQHDEAKSNQCALQLTRCLYIPHREASFCQELF